jgi:crossover junction endodeoxyribonuclease RuvC
MLKHRTPTSTRLGQLILGVDPGLNTTGYGLVEVTQQGPRLREAGVVRGRSRGSLELRLQEIYDGVVEILTAHQPTAMAVEQLYSHYARPRTAILMGHARGVICLAAAQRGVPVRHYAATMVKKMLTGNGRASKAQVQMAICREFGLTQAPEPPDVADALAIALCHVFHRDVLAGDDGLGVTLDLDSEEA